ncbi:hypothetical protein [Jatrophihabitans lederbergiae]|uniref:Pilus assembly protein n=1 Tax=Jatrophihabitans lederbergiae TaxID=3075547 RepID=A0ABU2JIG0_9ACTN|nr:hypothetical protein [Jatrophihabitans sp. DSM 44399]MDT0264038.1 hypothetical protein [Jatrophihabitans sp. DSM 44399]
MMNWLIDRWAVLHHERQRGSVIVEFIFVALLVLVPLVYLVIAIAVVQRSRLATTNAARDVGRALATSDTGSQADAAFRIALASQGIPASGAELRYVGAGDDCQDAASVVPQLAPGSEFTVCVLRSQRLPAVPAILSGRGVTTIGRYVVHVDDFRPVG